MALSDGARVQRHMFGLLDCEDDPIWQGHEAIWFRCLELPDAEWKVFRCWNDEFPSEHEMNTFAGFVVTGSHYSVYEDHPWIQRLLQTIRYIAQTGRTKLLAGCFGAQATAEALGGKVGKNPDGHFVLKSEAINLNHKFFELPYVKAALREPWPTDVVPSEQRHPEATLHRAHEHKAICILQSHGDCVLSLPPDAQLVASSHTARHEIFTVGTHVLAMQSHPELSVADVVDKILPDVRDRMSDHEVKEAFESFQRPIDDQFLLAVCHNFFLTHETPHQEEEPPPCPQPAHDAVAAVPRS